MQIETILKTQQGNPHYINRYIKFIKACTAPDGAYIERHHICPKAFFPEYADLRTHKWNCAKLTARQHFIAHWMLAKAYGGAMWYGLKMMMVHNKGHGRGGLKMSSALYEKARTEFAQYHSDNLKGRVRGKHTSESIEKMREAKRGAKNPNYGRPNSDEQKAKISAANKGLKRTAEFCQLMKEVQERQPIKTCPHCGAQSKSAGNMNRWHGDNCKQKGA